jgi:nitroreductase
MAFDIAQIDTVLSTTRAVRLRLDLERQVPDEIITRCIDLAEQAPSGGNITSRRWLVIRDPEVKAQIAHLYREAGGASMIKTAEQLKGSGTHRERTTVSAAHLAQNMERVPTLVIPTIWGEHDGSGRPGLFDSVLQAAWSFCLALRARGLGTAWTTIILGKRRELAEILGIPEGVTPIVLLPVAWTIGTDFKPAARRPASQITWFDHWGYTNAQPFDGESLLAAQPGVTVEVDIAAPARRVWELVTDINLPSRFSDEFQGAEWVDVDGPRLGASFVGRNKRDDREWQTTSFVVACDPPRVFAWNVSDPERPGAQWRFELDRVGDTTRLRQCMTMGPGMSGTSRAMENEPDKAQEILAARRETLRRNMELTTQEIKRLAESTG